jgi:hypothetical protein
MALYFWRNRKGASRKQWDRSEWWFCNNTTFLCPRWALRFCEIPFIVLQKFHASRKYEQCGFSLQDLLMELEKRCWCCPCLIDDTMHRMVWAGALELLRGCAPKSCKWLLLVSPLFFLISRSGVELHVRARRSATGGNWEEQTSPGSSRRTPV